MTTVQPARRFHHARLDGAMLMIRAWGIVGLAAIGLRTMPLPRLVAHMGRTHRTARPRSTFGLGRRLDRLLRLGPWRPRCLLRALVLFRLLRLSGQPVELVIGLPQAADDHRAHSWVELHGVDVGPMPGGGGYAPIARYG